jgi:hypothetical protein
MVLLVAVLPESPRVVIFAIAGAPPSAGQDAAEHVLGQWPWACSGSRVGPRVGRMRIGAGPEEREMVLFFKKKYN